MHDFISQFKTVGCKKDDGSPLGLKKLTYIGPWDESLERELQANLRQPDGELVLGYV